MVPSQDGAVLITGAEGVSVVPQLSVTVGNGGGTANATQATVDPLFCGIVKSSRSIVYV